MLSTADKYLFFVASFSPLWAIMTARYVMDNPDQMHSYVGIAIVLAIVVPSIILTAKKFADLQNSTNSKVITVVKSEEITKEYIPYVISHLFPILVVIDGAGTLFAVVAAMALVGILYVKTRMVLTNPALILAGFRIYEVRAKSYARPIKIISKRFPEAQHKIRIRDMGHDLAIEHKSQQT